MYPEYRLQDIPPDALDALLEHVTRLKHDLGKYIRFQGRWLGEEASLEDRTQALRADLLETRRGPTGSIDALTVWAEFSGALAGEIPLAGIAVDLRDDPDVGAIFAGMAALEPVIAGLGTGGLAEEAIAEGERQAEAVASAVRALVTRVRARVDG